MKKEAWFLYTCATQICKDGTKTETLYFSSEEHKDGDIIKMNDGSLIVIGKGAGK